MPPDGADILDLRLTAKRFAPGAPDVLRDVAFRLRRGETLALMGPSGAGKTTLLRIVAGLDRDFAGTLVRAPDARLAMAFQEPRLLPWRDVETNIRLAAPDILEDALAALLDDLRLSDHRRHGPRQLSLGLARRVSLARAFAVAPDLLILDEPFASLDPALARDLRADLARSLAARGAAALFTTHEPREAVELARRVLVLGGRPATLLADVDAADPQRAQGEIAKALGM